MRAGQVISTTPFGIVVLGPRKPRRSEWRVERGPNRYNKFATWFHTSGAVVRHCGHPTANHPYTAWRADGRMITMLKNGRNVSAKFSLLGDAQQAALGVTR